MIGKYKLYEEEPEREELDAMTEDELIDYFGGRISINARARERGGCPNCESERWYQWRTNSTLDRTYWLCTDCYQVKLKAATG